MYKRVWGSVLSLSILAVAISPVLAQDTGWPKWEKGLFLHAKVGKGSDGLYLIEAMGFKPLPPRKPFQEVVDVAALKVDPTSLPLTALHSSIHIEPKSVRPISPAPDSAGIIWPNFPIPLEPKSVQIIWPADGNNVSALKRLFPATIFQSRGSIPDVTFDPKPVWDPTTQKWIPKSPIQIDPVGPPPIVPWWMAPFSYAPDHMQYLPAGSAILEKVRGADRYRIVSRPGENGWNLPSSLAFIKRGNQYILRHLQGFRPMVALPDTIHLSKVHQGRMGRGFVYEAIGGRPGRRLPTNIAVIRNPAPWGKPSSYQFAIRGGNIKINNPPLTPQRPSNPQPNWRGGANDVVRGAVAREVGGLAQFAAAYLVKEGVKAALTGDAEVMKQAVRQMGTGSFWASLGVFTVASGATDFALRALPLNGAAQAISRAALPLAAGMAAIQVLRGEASAKSVAISTGAYLGAGVVVGTAADTLLYPLLFRATPPGWAMAAYTVGKLAATLYAGEKFEEWLSSMFNRRTQLGGTSSSSARSGVADQIERLVND